jgi:hypothetical protein
MPDSDPTTMAAEAITRLEALSDELTRAGWRTRMKTTPERVPCLHVQNPQPGATALREDIYCAPRNGTWTYWWSWAEAICTDVSEAAGIIGKVLRAAEPADAIGR